MEQGSQEGKGSRYATSCSIVTSMISIIFGYGIFTSSFFLFLLPSSLFFHFINATHHILFIKLNSPLI